MEGTSQDQSHNVITIEHAIVSRIFMACKEHSWRNVLVGGFETGSRPSRKCKSMQILWVNILCFFFSIMFVPESAHGVQRHKKHTTYSVPSCFCNVPSRSFKSLCGPFASGKSFWDFYPYILWIQLSALRWCYGRKCACAISVVEWQRRIPDFKIQDSIFQVV